MQRGLDNEATPDPPACPNFPGRRRTARTVRMTRIRVATGHNQELHRRSPVAASAAKSAAKISLGGCIGSEPRARPGASRESPSLIGTSVVRSASRQNRRGEYAGGKGGNLTVLGAKAHYLFRRRWTTMGRPRPLLAVFAVFCSEISVIAPPRSFTWRKPIRVSRFKRREHYGKFSVAHTAIMTVNGTGRVSPERRNSL